MFTLMTMIILITTIIIMIIIMIMTIITTRILIATLIPTLSKPDPLPSPVQVAMILRPSRARLAVEKTQAVKPCGWIARSWRRTTGWRSGTGVIFAR